MGFFTQLNAWVKKGISSSRESKIAGQNETCVKITSDSFIQSMHNKLELELDSDSIFYKLGSSGLITFSDYIFLLTVLSSEYKFIFIFSGSLFITVMIDVFV
jgi:hypothetical protein